MSILPAIWRSNSEQDLLQRAAAWAKGEMGASEVDLWMNVHGRLAVRASTHPHESRTRFEMEEIKAIAESCMTSRQAILKPLGPVGRITALPVGGPESVEGVILGIYPSQAAPDHRGDLGLQVHQALRLFRSAFELGGHGSRLTAVTEVTQTISQSPYLEEILQLLVHMTAQRFAYKVVTVRLLDEKNQELVLRATQASNKAYQNKRAIRLNESIAGRVLRTGKFVVVPDVKSDPEYVGHDLAVEQGLSSMICLPLMVRDRPVGVITCYTGVPHAFEETEVTALETLANQAALSIEHAKLQVRSTLMQEMHHRVKNNLQQVASILRLQIRQSHYKDSSQALTDSLARILAISSVHDLLSRDDLDHVGLRDLAEMLGHHLQQSVIPPGRRISFTIRGDNVYLNTSQATQVALIMNEMIQNAVEHGFEHLEEGEVHVSIEENSSTIGLWVSNNGDPLPDGFNSEEGRLGLQIIHSLSRALGGKFVMENRLGWTVCEVQFQRAGVE
jgi:two-component system, sensor histidine kinase PdtaS